MCKRHQGSTRQTESVNHELVVDNSTNNSSSNINIACSRLLDSALPRFLPFYFRVCAFSIQRTQLSRSLEQANIEGKLMELCQVGLWCILFLYSRQLLGIKQS